MKKTTIDAFFKKRDSQHLEASRPISVQPLNSNIEASIAVEGRPSKAPRIESEEIDTSSLERDPGLRPPLWKYPINQQDEIRRAYIKAGPYQHILAEYPLSTDKHPRRFAAVWFKSFPNWLEYSPTKDAVFCLPCYLFAKPNTRPGSSAFTIDGFRAWRKVNGDKCAFVTHVGKHPNSIHKNAVRSCQYLANQSQHLEKVVEKQTSKEVARNRLRLKASIDAIKYLTFQACPLRGHDESPDSINRGNFLEMIKVLASYDAEVDAVVLGHAWKNATYLSHRTQKEILQIFALKTRKFIREEIGDAKFCIIVDEARDESKREQMALVLRFVDKDGFIKERFFDIVHVADTAAPTLKKAIDSVLSRNDLSSKNIRGQGYDGASNMRGEWNGLQALFCADCPYAYYIHCLAHRLQLALLGASREVSPVHQFFSKLTFVVNIVGASCKRSDQLKASQAAEIAELLANNELESGKGQNQIGTVKRAGDTRWGSHLGSIQSLIKMFNATCSVLKIIMVEGNYAQRGDADSAFDTITSFEFVFILHLMRGIMEITNDLCQALQRKSQEILNAMHLVSTTKILIQNMRDGGWDELFDKVKSFCVKHNITIPDMSARYTAGRGRPRHPIDQLTMEHHFRVDVFTATMDSQLQELNNRFKEDTVELLTLSSSLDPRDDYRSFNSENICKLASYFYPEDFTKQEKVHLEIQLQHYELEIHQHPELQKMSKMSDLCQVLARTGKSKIYPLIDKLIRLVLTLPVSTATTERAFSALNLVKTPLRNKMEDDYLGNYLITYIEKEIARHFDVNSIIDDFYCMRERRVQMKMPKMG